MGNASRVVDILSTFQLTGHNETLMFQAIFVRDSLKNTFSPGMLFVCALGKIEA
jgi:hypothetical protein